MNKLKLISFAVAITMGASSINASAEDCAWVASGFSISNPTQTFTNTFSCLNGGVTVATKTVTVKAKVAPTCALTINAAGYSNFGTCVTPNIAAVPPSGSKICEFNDPSTGTTPGCTQNGIGGGGNTVAYQVSKNGQPLLVVTKTTNNTGWSSSCTLAGENTGYYSSGDCNNYRVYAK